VRTKRVTFIHGYWAAALFIPVLSAHAERIELDQVPKAVMDGLRQEHPDAKELKVNNETHFGLTLYDFKFKESGPHGQESKTTR